jgi:hypothetical protein
MVEVKLDNIRVISRREVLYNILSYCGTSMKVGRLIQMHFSYYYSEVHVSMNFWHISCTEWFKTRS